MVNIPSFDTEWMKDFGTGEQVSWSWKWLHVWVKFARTPTLPEHTSILRRLTEVVSYVGPLHFDYVIFFSYRLWHGRNKVFRSKGKSSAPSLDTKLLGLKGKVRVSDDLWQWLIVMGSWVYSCVTWYHSVLNCSVLSFSRCYLFLYFGSTVCLSKIPMSFLWGIWVSYKFKDVEFHRVYSQSYSFSFFFFLSFFFTSATQFLEFSLIL